MVICLCGSTKFKNRFEKVSKDETLKGNIVLMPNVFMHKGDKITKEQKEMLDKLHLEKIKMCDKIIIITEGNYVGKSTKNEIEYAEKINKKCEYVNFSNSKKQIDNINWSIIKDMSEYCCNICLPSNDVKFKKYNKDCSNCEINKIIKKAGNK